MGSSWRCGISNGLTPSPKEEEEEEEDSHEMSFGATYYYTYSEGPIREEALNRAGNSSSVLLFLHFLAVTGPYLEKGQRGLLGWEETVTYLRKCHFHWRRRL